MKRTFSGTIPCLGLTHAYILESKNSNGDKSNAHVHGTMLVHILLLITVLQVYRLYH